MLNIGLVINRIANSRIIPGQCIKRHSHDFFQYMFVQNGCSQIIINANVYHAVKGQLILIPPHTEHSIVNNFDNVFESIDIKFTCDNEDAKNMLCRLAYCIDKLDSHYQFLARDIINQLLKDDIFLWEIVNIRLSEIIYHLLKIYMTRENDMIGMMETREDDMSCEHTDYIAFMNNDKTFKQTIDYIDKNICKKLNVSKISSMFGFSEPYFCSLFKKHYNISPLQYILNKKIIKAEELMLHSDMNISQISSFLGFNSISYFSRLFKRRGGLSPYEYTKQNKNTFAINIIQTNTGINSKENSANF